jgi:hypothetical protein
VVDLGCRRFVWVAVEEDPVEVRRALVAAFLRGFFWTVFGVEITGEVEVCFVFLVVNWLVETVVRRKVGVNCSFDLNSVGSWEFELCLLY